ncbi:hypothetical protein BT96DRAFT_913423 [Gymnopus androsaceus JB14]|uniref:Uncharacterized protein n=1 Tax=Gymnopus androsaceus JB14 TaxID=1447944 RepID=A0A6A4IJW4_9AGAR|nr:hypothetical protein BT96DRAFT_913423 [Gymnopus androsaceus JB14]
MSSRVFAYNIDPPYQKHSTQSQDTSFDMHADCGWSGSEGDESYIYPETAQTSVESISGDYREGYNDAAYYPNVQNSFHPATSITTYPQSVPQHAMQRVASSSSSVYDNPLSFAHTAGQSYHHDDPLSYPRVEDEDSNMVFTDDSCDDMITNDEEIFYDDGGSPGSVWLPEINQYQNQHIPLNGFNTSAEHFGWPGNPAATRAQEFGIWTKEMQYAYAQRPPDEAFFQHWFEGISTQDPSGYYPSYPVGAGDSSYYPTYLSAHTRNTPSDFTSSESPLSPLEFEKWQPDVSPAIPVGSLPAVTSSSILPEPIIHAPRPTRTIDSAFFERLLVASEASKD